MDNVELPKIDPDELRRLTAAYSGFPEHRLSLWDKWAVNLTAENFRGDNAFLSTSLDTQISQYVNAYRYVSAVRPHMLANVPEDGSFGCPTFEMDGCVFSRDSLDSVLEISALDDLLSLRDNGRHMLDCGAGYGRFAHRMSQLIDTCQVHNVDATPKATIICREYLRWRGVRSASVWRLDQVDALMGTYRPSIFCNTHSFSEATTESINAWLKLCEKHSVEYIWLVPHTPEFKCWEVDGSRPSYKHLLDKHGYKLAHEQMKWPIGYEAPYQTVYSLWEKKS